MALQRHELKALAIELAASMPPAIEPAGPAAIELCRNDEERQMLRDYRNADDAGKARAMKTLILGAAGRLPSVEEIKAMGPQKWCALLDSMEVTP